MSNEMLTSLTAIIIALLAAIPQWFTYRNRRKQLVDQGESEFIQILRDDNAKLRQRLDDMERRLRHQESELAGHRERIRELENDNVELHAGIKKLTAQLITNDIEPMWEPPI